MGTIPIVVALASFAIPGIAYLVITGLLAVALPPTRHRLWLLLATFATAAWGFTSFALITRPEVPVAWLILLDATHLAFWVAFVGSLLARSTEAGGGRVGRLFSLSVLAICVLLLLNETPVFGMLISGRLQLVLALAVPLIGLLGLEQVFRNANYEQRSFLKLMMLSIGLLFVINLFVYSQALLLDSIGLMSWSLRGLGAAAVAPVMLLAVKRQPEWGQDLYVSRHVVFYSTSLSAAGVYLLAMAAGGYLIGSSALTWSPILQAVFLVLSGGVLVYALFSRALRTRFRVFLAKHFYRNRYDYREEWLRLIETLTSSRDQTALQERAVKALAEIVDSERGELWMLVSGDRSGPPNGCWPANQAGCTREIPEPVVEFMRRTHWVVDTDEYVSDPEKYSNAFRAIDGIERVPSIFVPLCHENELVGIVRLERPVGIGRLGFEDHDLLKTAGMQVAIFLVQERDKEALSETRQFEAFSRLTTFLMHDLKNLISQQELVVGNAKRHKHRPEFIDDAITTMDASVKRMRKLLERLKSTDQGRSTVRVDVARLLNEVAAACTDREPAPQVAHGERGSLQVAIDREKFAMALTHAIRNAQDATPPNGMIEVRLRAARNRAVIEIEDNGTGMEASFVRDRLFKPFESTKGAQGMGIGAYQIRETVRAAGGDVKVTTAPGEGTLVTLELPLALTGHVPIAPHAVGSI